MQLSLLESGRHRRDKTSINCQELIANKGHPSDARHRNQAGDQAILDSGRAGLIFEKMSERLFHFLRSSGN
jgi:hypothetical protein